MQSRIKESLIAITPRGAAGKESAQSYGPIGHSLSDNANSKAMRSIGAGPKKAVGAGSISSRSHVGT